MGGKAVGRRAYFEKIDRRETRDAWPLAGESEIERQSSVAGVRTSKLIVRARCLRFVRSFIVRLRVCQFFFLPSARPPHPPPFQLFLRLFSTIYLRRCPSSSIVSSSSFVPLSPESFSSPPPPPAAPPHRPSSFIRFFAGRPSRLRTHVDRS